MKSLGVPFGEVCAQGYVLKLYQGGWGVPAGGVDPIEPGSENPPPGIVNTAGAVTISVDLLAPAGGPPLGVSWWVDNVVQPGATGDSFEFHPPAAGTFEVEIRVEDVTMLVHPDMAGTALESMRLWTVEASVPSDQIFADGFESGDTSAWSD